MQEPQKPTPKIEPAKRKQPARDGLLLGIVIGFAVWLPFMLFTSEFLSKAVVTLFAAVVAGLFFVALITFSAYIFRRRISRHFFGDVEVSIQAVSQAAEETMEEWPGPKAISSATRGIRELVALATWLMARRALMTVLLGMVGSLVAMVGTVLLLKQTEILGEQKAILDKQTKILASEGSWERLWKAHYSSEPANRLEAALELSKSGNRLSGLKLVGPQPLAGKLWQFKRLGIYSSTPESYSIIDLRQLKNAFTDIPNFPKTLLANLENSEIERYQVFVDRIPNRDFRDLNFRKSRIFIGNAAFVVDCSFEHCILDPQGNGTTFRDCKLDACLIESTPMGRGWRFEMCEIGEIAIFSSGERDLSGVPLSPNASKRSVLFRRSNISAVHIKGSSLVGFQRCRIMFLLLEGEFKDSMALNQALSELLASDCIVTFIAVGVQTEETFQINNEMTKEANLWAIVNLNK